jgi:hypothetical protein
LAQQLHLVLQAFLKWALPRVPRLPVFLKRGPLVVGLSPVFRS